MEKRKDGLLVKWPTDERYGTQPDPKRKKHKSRMIRTSDSIPDTVPDTLKRNLSPGEVAEVRAIITEAKERKRAGLQLVTGHESDERESPGTHAAAARLVGALLAAGTQLLDGDGGRDVSVNEAARIVAIADQLREKYGSSAAR